MNHIDKSRERYHSFIEEKRKLGEILNKSLRKMRFQGGGRLLFASGTGSLLLAGWEEIFLHPATLCRVQEWYLPKCFPFMASQLRF